MWEERSKNWLLSASRRYKGLKIKIKITLVDNLLPELGTPRPSTRVDVRGSEALGSC